jgi:hypothetical protein
MRCFYHHDKEAVALCRGCGRGVCAECGVDVGRGLACRGRCEDFAREFIASLEHGIEARKKTFGQVRVIESSPGIKVSTEPQSSKANPYLTAAVTQQIAASSRFRASIAIFHLLVGIILLAWGFSAHERLVWPFLIGICFVVYAAFSLLPRRSSTSETQKTQTT